MIISVTAHYKLNKKKFERTGAFDALLTQDTHLFIDPFLLNDASHPIFKKSRQVLLRRFQDVIKLLLLSKQENDIFWRRAFTNLSFKEMAGFGFGYSKNGISGSGIGPKFTKQLLKTADAIVKAGIIDPEIFELVGLMEEGIGCDRISDMTVSILMPLFFEYTDSVFTACGKKFPGFEFNDKIYNVPAHPFKSSVPVLLCPKEFLRDLPLADEWGDIGHVCAENAKLRAKLNTILGSDWRDKTKGYKKYDVRKLFVENPDVLKEVVSTYKDSEIVRYDWESDPSGEYVWRDAATELASKVPLALKKQQTPEQVSLIICEHFRSLVENNGLWKLLYKDNAGKNRKHERASQLLFFGVASAYCNANDIDISPESNGGSGPVDFKLSKGARGKHLVEVKLSTNSKMISGFEKQVEIYKKSEGADSAIYLVLIVGDSTTLIDKLDKLVKSLKKKSVPHPYVIYVDARFKKSASKR